MKEQVDRVLAELTRHGSKGTLVRTGTGHYRVAWHTADNKPRSIVISSNASDYRAVLNNVAAIRRQMREDGIAPLDETPARERLPQKICNAAELQPIFHELGKLHTAITELFDYVTAPTPVDYIAPVEKRKNYRATSLLPYLSFGEYKTADKIAHETSRPVANINAALKTLLNKRLVAWLPRIGWRRLPVMGEQDVIVTLKKPGPAKQAKAPAKRKTNGHAKPKVIHAAAARHSRKSARQASAKAH